MLETEYTGFFTVSYQRAYMVVVERIDTNTTNFTVSLIESIVPCLLLFLWPMHYVHSVFHI